MDVDRSERETRHVLPATTMMMKLFCRSDGVHVRLGLGTALDLFLCVLSLRFSILFFIQIWTRASVCVQRLARCKILPLDRVFSFDSSEIIGHTVAFD